MEINHRQSNQETARVLIITILVIFATMTPVDLSVIARTDWAVFLVCRVFVSAFVFTLLVKIQRRTLSARASTWLPWILWLINLFHLCVDVYFRAGYVIGYFQTVMIWAFFFHLSRREFRWQLAVGQLFFGVAFYFSKAIVGLGLNGFHTDLYIGMVMTNLIAVYGHSSISERRALKQEQYRRFADAGRYTSMLVHDLKGMMATPLISAAILKRELKDTSNPRIQAVMKGLEESLTFSKDLVSGANRLSSAQLEKGEPISMSELLSAIEALLKARMRNGAKLVLRDPEQCPPVSQHHNLLFRTLLNVLTNSLDAIEERKSPNPRMEVSCQSAGALRRIVLWDNAGGFSPATLKRLNQGQYISTKKQGSGLGCMIVSDYMEIMGGVVQYSNETRGAETGACVTLVFG